MTNKERNEQKLEMYRLFQELTPENQKLVMLKIAELKRNRQEQSGEVSNG